MKISVVVPTFNEEAAVSSGLQSIIDLKIHKKHEIIYVNDGSTDNTSDEIKKYPVKLLHHNTNKGYGAAIKTGIRHSKGDKIVILDSDGQHDPKYLVKIVDMLNQYDMVIGQRDDESFQVKRRQAGKKLIKKIGEYLVEQKLPDYNSGYRGFDKELIQKMIHIMPNGFSFSTTSTLAFLKEGYTIGTFPITVKERIGRKSNVKFIKDGSKTILLVTRIIMLFNPLKIFVPFSVLFIFFGVSWGVFGYINYSRFSNSAVLLTVFGALTFFIGLISDQIALLNRSKS